MIVSATGVRSPALARWVRAESTAIVCLIAALTALRFVTAAHLPLSFDETYFWLWSKHLSLSYYDHPPLIALTIRAGTFLFGDSEFGVRACSLFCSVVASWAVWRAAAVWIGEAGAGAFACALFNATLMATSQFIVATPDALVMTAAALLLLSLAKLQQTGDGRWWLAVGASAGIAFLSKYTAFFLAGGVGLWCVASPRGRRWLRTPWPYAAGALALGCFAPALIWNEGHGWISFKFQFGRVAAGRPTYRYLLEFVLAQAALASPFILLPAMAGLLRVTKSWRQPAPVFAAAALVWPALLYFALHAVHDRVQGNWPSFVYPALAILAAWAMMDGLRDTRLSRLSKRAALPTAAVILAAVYLQCWTGMVALGKQDPVARITGIGVKAAAGQIGKLAAQDHAAAILTCKYVVTGWLAFYLPKPTTIVQIGDERRWLDVPRANAALLNRPLLYVTQEPAHDLPAVRTHFSNVRLEAQIPRRRGDTVLDSFYVYALSGFHGRAIGRVVYEASR
jgi:4-amino-4-deoxy-L-arabinose transferase-like glycosyltransferase